jgi:hypothetical protein
MPMRRAFYQPLWNPDHASFRRRGTALLLALAVHALLLFMLLRLASVPPQVPKIEPDPVTFQLLPERGTAPAREPAAATKKRSGGGAAPRSAAPPPPVPPMPRPPQAPLDMIILNSRDFAAADISKLPTYRPHQGPEGEQAGVAGDRAGSDSADASGTAPGGERLYDAQWHRKPTDAELAYYLPAGVRSTGWGMIACQTVENYRVENCRELDQSPLGSGLAGAVRQAAWQFRVLPPRIGGRPLVGAWVRIRIEYTEHGAK